MIMSKVIRIKAMLKFTEEGNDELRKRKKIKRKCQSKASLLVKSKF